MKLSDRTKTRIFKALKEAGHWYIVGVHNPWEHPLNVVKNCLAITFDGGIQVKFSVLGNGRLKVAEIRYTDFLHLDKMGIKEGDIISVKFLIAKILEFPFVTLLGQVRANEFRQPQQAIMFDDSPNAK